MIWKMLNGNNSKMPLQSFKTALRKLDCCKEKPQQDFEKVANDLEHVYQNTSREYYYSDFLRDWDHGFFAPLFQLLPPQIVKAELNEHIDRILNIMLGAGRINEIDPVTKESALYHAIVALDHPLINRLCDRGAHTTSEDWVKIGTFVINLTRANQYEQLFQVLNLSKQRREIEIDLQFKDEKGRTCLHWAAFNGRKDVCDFILQTGLKVDIMDVDHDGMTAADLAKSSQHYDLEQHLREQF